MATFREGVARFMSSADVAAKPPASAQPSEPMLKRGDHGPSVVQLQGLLGLAKDGVFGSFTEAAVIALQRRHKLAPDGLVGPKTWAVLEGET
jgi:peptidoglycan hydrolase-like protein with peptidoglycan-binding domain